MAAVGTTYFGETALLGEIAQDSTVEAEAGSEWLRLHWRDFEQCDILDPDDLRSMLQIQTAKTAGHGRQIGAQEVSVAAARRISHLFQPAPLGGLFFAKTPSTIMIFLIFVAIAVSGVHSGRPCLDPVQPGAPGAHDVRCADVGHRRLHATIGWSSPTGAWSIRRSCYSCTYGAKRRRWRTSRTLTFGPPSWGAGLDFGTLIVQTAGTTGTIAFDYTTHFDTLRSVIKTQQEQRKRHAAAKPRRRSTASWKNAWDCGWNRPAGSIGAATSRPKRAVARPLVAQQRQRKHDCDLAQALDGTGASNRVGLDHVACFFLLVILTLWANTSDQIPDDWLVGDVWVRVRCGRHDLDFLCTPRMGDRRLAQRHLRGE